MGSRDACDRDARRVTNQDARLAHDMGTETLMKTIFTKTLLSGLAAISTSSPALLTTQPVDPSIDNR